MPAGEATSSIRQTGETWSDGIEGLLDEEEHTSRGRTMLPIIKYIWPPWIGIILQFFTNAAGDFVFEKQDLCRLGIWSQLRRHSLRRRGMVVDVGHSGDFESS